MTIEKLERYGLENVADDVKWNQISMCQADSTRNADYFASGDAWIATRSAGRNPQITASCNVLDGSWVLSGNKYSRFHDNDEIQLAQKG